MMTETQTTIDGYGMMNVNDLHTLIDLAYYRGQRDAGMNLDNLTANRADMSAEENDMSKRIKQRATINGKEQWITGETQQDIFNAYLQHAINAGIVTPVDNALEKKSEAPLFGGYLLNFLDLYRNDQEETTIANRNHMIKRHILPKWGETPVDEIKTDNLQAWFNEMGKEYKQETLLKIKNHMSPALDSAVEDGYIKRNPFKSQRFKITGKAGEHHKAIPSEQMKHIRENITNLPDRERRMATLLSYTGMCMEEVLGLRWEDLDFTENKIHIRRAVVHPRRNRVLVKDTLKNNHRKRDIPLQDKVIQGLQPLQSRGFIVGGDTPLTYQQQKYSFDKLRKALRADDYTSHDFRDTCATEWFEMGMPLLTVSKLLGHANTKVTEKCYVKFRETSIEDARQYMQAV